MSVHKSYFLAVSVLLLALVGCAPSGGGSSASVLPDGVTPIDDGGDPGIASTTGGVALLIRDNPLETIDSLLLTITRVELLGGPDGPFVLFAGSERIDILDFQATEFLLAMRDDVPPGEYSKIRLHIEDPEVLPNPDGLEVHQTGNGKLDLNPQGGFEVVAGEFLAIRVDLDARRSIQVVANQNHFILRPLVFVDIVSDFPPIPLGDLVGTITEVDLASDELTILVPGRADDVVVRAEAGTTIFDTAIQSAPLSVFAVGEDLLSRGRLDSTGTLVAEVVIEGQPERVRGELTAGNEPSPFPLLLGDGKTPASSLLAELAPEARVWREHGSEIDPPPLAAGSRALITGHSSGEPVTLRGGLMDIELERRRGSFETIDHAANPLTFVFRDTADHLLPLTLDPEATLGVIGDGAVPAEYLTEGLEAVVTISELEDGSLVATALSLEPTTWVGTITAVDLTAGSIVVSVDGVETVLALRPDATILRRTDLVTVEVGLSNLAVGDVVEAFGLFDTSGVPALWVIVWEFSAVEGTLDAVDNAATPQAIVVRDAFDRLFSLGVPAGASVILDDGTTLDAALLTAGLSVVATIEGLTGDLLVSTLTVGTTAASGVVTAVDPDTGTLTIEGGSALIEVTVLDGAPIGLRIDAVLLPANLSAVAIGDVVQLTGVPHPTGGFVASVIEVTIDAITGTIEGVNLTGSNPLIALRDGNNRAFLFTSTGAPVLDLAIPVAIDTVWLSVGRIVTVDLDGTTGNLLAPSLLVTPQLISGQVTAVDPIARTLELEGATHSLHVHDSAALIEQTGTGDVPLDLTTLASGTQVEARGLMPETGLFEVWDLRALAP